MKNVNTAIRLIAVHRGLATRVALAADPAAVLHPPAGINLEYIGQGLVVSPAEVYQYGYFTHVAGVENLFSGAPNNASTAFFTFLNELSTTRVTDNGPLRIVDRKGTATIYLNPAGGANFEDPDSFSAGTPVLTAALRHQVILDTLNGNTIIVNFDLTVTAAEFFTVGDIKHRLGQPGQKMTWTAYGRPNTSATQPGQFVFAGMGFSIVPAPLGLSIHRPAGSGAIQPALENLAGVHSREEGSPESKGSMLLASVDRTTAKAVVTDEKMGPSKLYRAITE